MNHETRLVEAFAEQIETRLVKRLISCLQEMKDCRLSGDDSVLENTWDEICVQVQDEESVYWDAYDETVRSLVETSLRRLLPIELQAVWLRTNDGQDWSCDDDDHDPEGGIPARVDQVTSHIVQIIYNRAANWSNRRIRRFLERHYD